MLMRSTQKLSQVIGLQIWWSLLVKVDFFQKMLLCLSDPQTFVQKHCSHFFFSFSWCWILPLTFWFLFKKSTNLKFFENILRLYKKMAADLKLAISPWIKVQWQWFHTKVWGFDKNHNVRRYFQFWSHQ